MKIVELFEEESLSPDEIDETLNLLLRMFPKETEPQLVKFHSIEHQYIKGYTGYVRNRQGELTTDKRWYRLEYVNGQWILTTTTRDGHGISRYFSDEDVEGAVDVIKSLYKNWKKDQET
jgi:hypothetical protein